MNNPAIAAFLPLYLLAANLCNIYSPNTCAAVLAAEWYFPR